MEKAKDEMCWKAKWRIDKFKDPAKEVSRALQTGMPMEQAVSLYGEAFICTEKFESNIALNEGLQALIELACGISTPAKWDNSNARLGVGDSNAAEDPSQTGLQAATNKAYKAMDGSYPQRSGQTVEWRATFGTDEANFAWEEYTVVNAADDSGVNLNRKIASKGTKASGETWTLSLQINFS
jgi:hypothetical protein